MSTLIKSLGQAFASLFKMKMFLLLFGPPALTGIALLVLYVSCWNIMITGLGSVVSHVWGYSWIVQNTGFQSLNLIIAGIFLVLTFFPLAYVISVVITSVLAMPVVVGFVSSEYSQLEKRKGGSNIGSVGNVVTSGISFVFWLIVTLPLWLIPGAQIILPLYLTARFNKKVFMYDVLQDYADKSERNEILMKESIPLTGMGMILGLLAYIPFAFIFLPIISALAFTYYGFNSLTKKRVK